MAKDQSIITLLNSALESSESVSTTVNANIVTGFSIDTSLDSALEANRTLVTSINANLALTTESSRTVTTGLSNALGASEIEPFFAVSMEFDSGDLNLWTGYNDITFGGKTYLGAGALISISSVEETSDMKAVGASLVLNGIPSSVLSLALVQPYQNRLCTIYFGVRGDTTEATEIFSGYMDQMNVTESAETSTVELIVENKLVDLEKIKIARYTSAYQKNLYPGDNGLDFVESLQDKKLVWGKSV